MHGGTTHTKRRAQRLSGHRGTRPWSAPLFGLLAAISCLGLGACSGLGLGGPEYTRPAVPEKDEWTYAGEKISARETIRPDWWQEFDDNYLDGLIDQAISDNISISVLAGRINVARAGIGVAEAGGQPTILAAGGVDYIKNSQLPGSTTTYSVGSSLDWELDIWGKVEKGVQAQQAEYQASEADWRAGYLSLVSDVATTYFSIRLFDEQVDRQRDAIDTNNRILDIYHGLHNEGLIPETQVLQQRAEVARLNNGLLELERRRTITDNGMSTLLGTPAGTHKVPAAHLSTEVKLLEVPADLPSSLLARRPDIVAAEYRLLRAHNLAAQARLAKLPSIGLTSRIGSASTALSDLLKAYTLGISPSITFPVFDPNVRAQVKVSEAQSKLAIDEYRVVVIGAFEEVENALVNLSSHKEQRQQFDKRVADLRVVANQIRAQLIEGIVSQLEVFESERSLLQAEQELLENRQQILSDTVELYKAMGGGWPAVQVKNPK